MNNNIAFCENCRKEVTFRVKETTETIAFKGEDIEFAANATLCEQCGNPVYVGKYMDANLNALYDAYRLKNNIISLEHIRQIPVKYAIGKRPFSLLLGWGELTFTRYCDGDMPSKQYADILNRVYNDPAYYLSILENRKETLKPSSYRKSFVTAQKILEEPALDETMLYRIAKYILSECNDITNLTLQKSLYYIQGLYHAFYNEFLFEDDCEAWVHGPVYKDIYNRYAIYGYGSIDNDIEFDGNSFPTDKKALIDSVIKYFCCYSGKTLEKFTHIETPWLLTRGDLLPKEQTNRIISKKLIGDYFTAVKDKYNMLTPADIKSYSTAMFDKV